MKKFTLSNPQKAFLRHASGLTEYGKKFTDEHREKMSKGNKDSFKAGRKQWNYGLRGWNSGDKNPMWKGNKAGLDAIHIWIRKRLPKPKKCQNCKIVPPLDLANISQNYKRILSDWEWLCRKCHMIKDGRLKKFLNK